MRAGKFITLEGVDGAGKSTHVHWIAERLRRRRARSRRDARARRHAARGETARAVLAEPMDPLAETLLMFAARADHVRA